MLRKVFNMNETVKIEKIIEIIQASDLDQTIKDILIRDIKSEGLTEFLKEQVIAYCDKTISLIDKRLAKDE